MAQQKAKYSYKTKRVAAHISVKEINAKFFQHLSTTFIMVSAGKVPRDLISPGLKIPPAKWKLAFQYLLFWIKHYR